MGDAIDPVEEYMAERQERIDKRLRRIAEWQVWPHHIAAMLQRHVVGQDEAVRRMAVLLRGHVLRMQVAIEDGTAMQPPRQRGEGGPVLLIGPSGVGKSHLIRTMAGMANLPWVIEDATYSFSTLPGADRKLELLIAVRTSVAVTPRAANLIGSIQTRME